MDMMMMMKILSKIDKKMYKQMNYIYTSVTLGEVRSKF